MSQKRKYQLRRKWFYRVEKIERKQRQKELNRRARRNMELVNGNYYRKDFVGNYW